MGNAGSEILSEFVSDEDIVLGKYHVHRAPKKEAKAAHDRSAKKQIKRKKIEAKKSAMLDFMREQ